MEIGCNVSQYQYFILHSQWKRLSSQLVDVQIDLIFSLDIAKYFCPLLSYISVLRKFFSLISSYHTVFLALEIFNFYFKIIFKTRIIYDKWNGDGTFYSAPIVMEAFLKNFPLKAIKAKTKRFLCWIMRWEGKVFRNCFSFPRRRKSPEKSSHLVWFVSSFCIRIFNYRKCKHRWWKF